MSIIPIILIGILILTVFVLVIIVFLVKNKSKNKENKEVDYRVFFIMGTSFLPLGIVLTFVVGNPGFIGFMGLGICYTAIGLANKDKWKNEK